MKIAIVGDSFSSDTDSNSWVSLLGQNHDIYNFSQRGISQFRIYKIFLSNIDSIQKCDCLILWDTNPYRVYLNDEIDYPTRQLSSHPHADMVTEDSMMHKEFSKIAKIYYKYFFDEEQQNIFSKLLIQDMVKLMNFKVIRCSGFNSDNKQVKSFLNTRQKYSGTINHMSAQGNKIVYNYRHSSN